MGTKTGRRRRRRGRTGRGESERAVRMRRERAAAVSCAGADENKTPPQQPACESLRSLDDGVQVRPTDINRSSHNHLSILLKYQHETTDSHQEIVDVTVTYADR